jgi:hypothetical protein
VAFVTESFKDEMAPTTVSGVVRRDTSAQSRQYHEPETDATAHCFPNSSKLWIAIGIFLLVFGIYALSGPGRIDILDSEARFDVALNWLTKGRPIVTDHWIGPIVSVSGRDGLYYSYYGPAGSFFSIPLIWLSLISGASSIQPGQFLFSLTSAVFGAGIASILFLFYLELGVNLRRALAWTLVSSFATYVWAISASTFDNAQHAFFAVAAVYFAFLSARRKSWVYALCGGLFAGVLFLYQEYLLLIIPALALATLDSQFWNASAETSTSSGQTKPSGLLNGFAARVHSAIKGPGDARDACLRYCTFLAAVGVGILLMLVYNDARFGSLFDDGKLRHLALQRHPAAMGNPLSGLLTLLFSPGKGLFLYSPPLILGILGIGGIWRRKPHLAFVIVATSLALVLFISCLSFAGGDWCWGPRYLAPLLPLWALAFPFVPRLEQKRGLLIAVIAAGLVVQILALSVENQRFFFERALNDYFWAEDPWFYFKHSALIARFGETVSLFNGLPANAHLFNSIPSPDLATYSLLGPPLNTPRSLAPVWMQNYKIFFLPRPWPLWVSALDPTKRPIPLAPWVAGLLGMIVLGAGFIYRELQTGEGE